MYIAHKFRNRGAPSFRKPFQPKNGTRVYLNASIAARASKLKVLYIFVVHSTRRARALFFWTLNVKGSFV